MQTSHTMRSKMKMLFASLYEREEGVAMTEYLTVLVLVTLVGAGAVASLGIPLLRLYKHVQILLALPIP